MCSIKELSTHYWTDKESNKTYATVSMTVRMDNGTTKTHEYKCPTPVEEWEEHALSQDNWRKYRPTTVKSRGLSPRLYCRNTISYHSKEALSCQSEN
jgi:hypothetical protein